MESANLTLETKDGNRLDMRVLVVPKISTPLNTHVTSSVLNLPHLKDLKLAQSTDDAVISLDVLIGADYYWSVIGDNVVRGKGPTAVSSVFGYVLSGPTHEGPSAETRTAVMNIVTDISLEEKVMSNYWDLESIGIKDDCSVHPTLRDAFESYRDNKIRRNEDTGQYIASLPWADDHPPLPTNFAVTKARTRSMVRKLTPELRSVYHKIIREQLDRNFVSQVSDADPCRGHYLPHHPVKKDSATTPIQIVYDCSCSQGRGNPCLNNCLEPGPPLLNDLSDILLRFRVNNVGLSSDIEKAFLHVQLDERDREFTKFLWLSDPADPVKTSMGLLPCWSIGVSK
ncbi:uncharacterized protein LOC135496075 [Lineus longissimus]|uniref:uncharacterized protein LOC135496075 n=1 Tax=Lineus longissimus TaxID=88925 RepID=UPI00315D125C